MDVGEAKKKKSRRRRGTKKRAPQPANGGAAPVESNAADVALEGPELFGHGVDLPPDGPAARELWDEDRDTGPAESDPADGKTQGESESEAPF